MTSFDGGRKPIKVIKVAPRRAESEIGAEVNMPTQAKSSCLDPLARFFLSARILGGFPMKIKRSKVDDAECEGGQKVVVGIEHARCSMVFLLIFMLGLVGSIVCINGEARCNCKIIK